MLYLKYFIPLSLLLFSIHQTQIDVEETTPVAEAADSPRIAWDKNYTLKWKDFKGRADKYSTLDAYTMLGIELEVLGQKNGKVDMGVFGYFEKNKSWVKSKEETGSLLSHEQRHFDLCEVYRRMMIEKLEARNPYSYDGFSNEVSTIFNEMFNAYTQEQARYDHETHHSQKKEIQADWNKFIESELLRLEKYDKLAASLEVK